VPPFVSVAIELGRGNLRLDLGGMTASMSASVRDASKGSLSIKLKRAGWDGVLLRSILKGLKVE